MVGGVSAHHLQLTQLKKNIDMQIWNYFIDHGLDLSQPSTTYYDDRRNTLLPLTIAIQEKKYDLVKFLIERGADINALNEKYLGRDKLITFSALCELCRYSPDLEMISYFIDHGADVNIGDVLPISHAITSNNQDILKYLVDNGADLNTPTIFPGFWGISDDDKFMYPIQKVLSTDHVNFEQLKLVVDNGADVNMGDVPPLSMELAKSNPDQTVINYLIEKGAMIKENEKEKLMK